LQGRLQGLLAVFQRRHVAHCRADEQLAWAADLLLWVGDHFVPLGDSADGTGHGEDTGEQGYWDAQGRLHDAGVEVHVRILLCEEHNSAQKSELGNGGQITCARLAHLPPGIDAEIARPIARE